MKANNLFKWFILAAFFLEIKYAAGQEPKPCGTYKIDITALKKALDFEKSHPNLPQSSQVLIRVYFHICTCDDGSLPAATTDEVNGEEFSTLVASYEADNICFLNSGINYVYSSKLDTNFNVDNDDESLFDNYSIANCLNIFYCQKIKGNNNACAGTCGIGGYTFNVPGTLCLVSTGNIGEGQTISHEVGHCLGLLHTFDTANGYEDINGSNSSTSADLITDTPADPYAYIGQSCFSSDGCFYNGSCKDPRGKSNFSPPYTNLMAYWWVNCNSNLAATAGQFVRVNNFLATDGDLQACESPADVTEGPNVNISFGYLMSSAVSLFQTTGSVVISGTAQVTFGGQTVLLEPGFQATPSITGALFLARTSICNSTLLPDAAKTNYRVNYINEPIVLTIYPNPTDGKTTLSFPADEEYRYVLNITDMMGKMVMSSKGIAAIGENKIDVDLSSYSAGIYFINMQNDKQGWGSFKLVRQ